MLVVVEELDERRAGAKLGGGEMRIEAQQGGAPQLISTYPSTWTAHYLKNQYERFDPVITQALEDTEPIQWGLNSRASILSRPQRELFEDAARFGIACGFTIPIHDGRGPIAAVTFAADERRGAAFPRRVEGHRQVLPLMATYFQSHEGPHGGNTLPHQNASKSSRRDGSVLAYNLTWIMNIVGTKPLMAAIVA
jgi:hypothetical protein